MKLRIDELETVRLTRNAINYRGTLLTKTDWQKYEAQFHEHEERARTAVQDTQNNR